MSNYTYSTNFGAKDALNTGDPNKLIKGVDFDTEFSAISTAITTKADLANPTFTGTVTIPTAAVTTLSLDGTTITATGTELNRLDVSAGVATPLKAMVFGGNNRIRFNDNYTVTFGDSNNLHIFHDGTDSHIKEYNNPLNVDGIGVNVQHNGSTKLATSTTGVAITGEMSATTINIGGTAVTATAAELNLVDGLTAIPNYATGTFTPTVRDFGGVTCSVGTTNARYVVVGDLVTVFMDFINIDTTGKSASSAVKIQDLPFTALDDAGVTDLTIGSGYIVNGVNPTATDSGHFIPVLNNGTSTITLNASVNNQSQPELLLFGDLNDDTADIHITMTYQKA